MYRYQISLLIIHLTIITFIELRPLSKYEQILPRSRRQNSIMNNQPLIDDIWNQLQPVLTDHLNSHLSDSTTIGCHRTIEDAHITDKGDFVEYCLDKIPDPNGISYSTRTSATLHKADGRKIPLHQAESNIEIETHDHHNY